MRIPKFMITSTVCLAVVGGAALVYAQGSYTPADRSTPSQTSTPQPSDPSTTGSQAPGTAPMSGTTREYSPAQTGTTPESKSGATMDSSSTSPSQGSSERAPRADRN